MLTLRLCSARCESDGHFPKQPGADSTVSHAVVFKYPLGRPFASSPIANLGSWVSVKVAPTPFQWSQGLGSVLKLSAPVPSLAPPNQLQVLVTGRLVQMQELGFQADLEK